MHGCIDKEENQMWFTGAKEIPRDVCVIHTCARFLCLRDSCVCVCVCLCVVSRAAHEDTKKCMY